MMLSFETVLSWANTSPGFASVLASGVGYHAVWYNDPGLQKESKRQGGYAGPFSSVCIGRTHLDVTEGDSQVTCNLLLWNLRIFLGGECTFSFSDFGKKLGT